MQAKIDQTLNDWHRMVATKNLDGLHALLAPDIVFRSPIVFPPYKGAAKAQMLLAAAVSVFEDFEYQREFVNGQSAVMEFAAKLGDLSLKGVDLITFDDDGKMTEFEVLIRPASALQALGQAMGKRLAQTGARP